MEAAICAFERGHDVTLYEKSNALGGQLKIASQADFKWPLKKYTQFLIDKALNTGFQILLNTEATFNIIKDNHYDVVIVAIGAKPLIPAIKGIDKTQVLYTDDAYLHEDKIGQHVVIIGGGEVGVETAFYLNGHGKETTIIEKQDMLMPQASFEHYYYLVECEWEKRNHFHIHVNTQVTQIQNNQVICEKDGQTFCIQADTILISSGYKAKSDEAYLFGGSAPQYFCIGDCQKLVLCKKLFVRDLQLALQFKNNCYRLKL